MDLLTPSSPGGLPTLSLTTNSSWLPWLPCLSSALWCQYPILRSEMTFVKSLNKLNKTLVNIRGIRIYGKKKNLAILQLTSNNFKHSSTLQQGWSSVNRNMTAYRLQSGTSCTGYQFVNGSSSRRVFSCTTACTIYHPAICPACVSRSLSTPAADSYDQLHAATSSSQPQEQSATALVASPLQDQLRGLAAGITPQWPTVCRCISPSTQDWTFCQSIRLFSSTLATVVNCKSGRT